MAVVNPAMIYTNVIPATEHTPLYIDTTHPDYEMVQVEESDDESQLPIVPEEKKVEQIKEEKLEQVKEKMEQMKETLEPIKEEDEDEDDGHKSHFLNYLGLVSKDYNPPPRPLNVGKKMLRNRLVDVTLPFLPAQPVPKEQEVEQKKNGKGKSLLASAQKPPKSKTPPKSKPSKKKSKSPKVSLAPPAKSGSIAPVLIDDFDPSKPSCSFWYPSDTSKGSSKTSAKKPAASTPNSSNNPSNTSKGSSKHSNKKPATSTPNSTCDPTNTSKGSSKTSAKKPATSTPKPKQKPTSSATPKSSKPHPINDTKNDLDQPSLPSTSKGFKQMSKKELLDALVEKLTTRLKETALESASASAQPSSASTDQISTPESTDSRKSIPVSVIKYAPRSDDKSKSDANESEIKEAASATVECEQPEKPADADSPRLIRKAVRRNNPKLDIEKPDESENAEPTDEDDNDDDDDEDYEYDGDDADQPPEVDQPGDEPPRDFIFGEIERATYNQLMKIDIVKEAYEEKMKKLKALEGAPPPRTKKEIKEANTVIINGVPKSSPFHPNDAYSHINCNFTMKYEKDPTVERESALDIRKKAKFELQIQKELLEAIVQKNHNPNMARNVVNSGVMDKNARDLNNLASRKSRMKQILMTTVLENSVLAQRKHIEYLKMLKERIGQRPPYNI